MRTSTHVTTSAALLESVALEWNFDMANDFNSDFGNFESFEVEENEDIEYQEGSIRSGD